MTGGLELAFIRYHETEKLFTAWPKLEIILESLSIDLNIVRSKDSTGTDDEYIYNLCIGNKVIDTMPPTGKISDSTYNIATNYGELMRCDRKTVRRELKDDLLEISVVLDKMQLAFRRLPFLQRWILDLYYWQGKTWNEIVELVHAGGRYYGKRQVQEKRRAGIERMKNVMQVNVRIYERIMGIVEERKEGDS